MDPVPAQLQGDLVGAQPAGVEEAEQLHPLEALLAEGAELPGPVLAQVPRVVGLLGAGRRQGEQVRGGDVGDPAGGQHRLEALEDRARVADVLDRLQEDDRVAGLREALDQVALEAKVGPHVAPPRVLVRLRVGVDPDHALRRARKHVGAVALAAGHVDHAPAGGPRRDPLVDGQMPPVPVVLLRHVGQRPLAGQRQRRHPRRLVQLQVLTIHGRGPYCGHGSRALRRSA